jgi:hypothetical protein
VKRRWLIFGAALALALFGAWELAWFLYPNDRSPKGAYYRVVTAVNQNDAEALFPYLETAAQHAAYSLHHYGKDSVNKIRAEYPAEQREEALGPFVPLANANEGPGVFALYAKQFGWLDRLKRDLSGIASVEINGERATVLTVRGTRYAFRRRDNGMWGLTLFTSQLSYDAEKAARDYSIIEAAAKDFSAGRAPPRAPSATNPE